MVSAYTQLEFVEFIRMISLITLISLLFFFVLVHLVHAGCILTMSLCLRRNDGLRYLSLWL